MDFNSKAIGVFDSGVGGLTAVSRLMQKAPNEKIIYFGDTARVPYGGRPPEEITRFSIETANFLLSKNVKAIVVACNTITVTCLKELTELAKPYDAPVFGIVEPAVSALVELDKIQRLSKAGIIATERTVNSGKYEQLINERLPHVKVFSKACPQFVTLAEEGRFEGRDTNRAVSAALSEFLENGTEALVLGCTHFPLLYDAIDRFCGHASENTAGAGGGIRLLDPAVKLAEEVCDYLKMNGQSAKEGNIAEPEFYLSGEDANFAAVSRRALGKEYGAVISKPGGLG